MLDTVIASPWLYLVLFTVAMLDGFFPVVPAETMVITAGVFAANGRPDLAPVIAVAAAGAFIGDHISYQIGRRAGQGLLRRLRPGSRGRAGFEWAARELDRRGGLVLVVARYIPGGRTAATMTTGALGYPRRRFALFDGVAAVSWALYSGVIGYLGGVAFEDNAGKGLLFGLGIAAGITALVELTRFLIARRRRPRRSHRPGPPDTPESPPVLDSAAAVGSGSR